MQSPLMSGRPRRTLHLVDLENIAQASAITATCAAVAQRLIEAAVPATGGGHVIVAASHFNGEAMCFGWSGSAQRLLRSGVDGADLALLDAVSDARWVAARYHHVVVASGDHAFAFAVAALKAAGCRVTVVSHASSLSRSLRLAAGPDLVLLPEVAAAGTVGPEPTSKDVA